MYDSEVYEVTSDTEIDELLSDLPLNLIKENISEQIRDPISSTTNYLNIVLEKYSLLKNNFCDNPDTLSQLNAYMNDFFGSIISELNGVMELEISDDLEESEIAKISDAAYNFFVIGYRQNVVTFFLYYIVNNKKSLSEHFDKMAKKKDVTTMGFKKQLKNKDDIVILSNIPNIISFIRDLDVSAEDFVKLVSNESSFESRYVQFLLNDGTISGDFVRSYLNIVFNEDDHVLDEIQLDIKMKLLNKLT